MFNNISVLIPFQSDNRMRKDIFEWVKRFYKTMLPGAEICIGEQNDEIFSRSKGINQAAQMATNSIFVIADADIFYDPIIITKSIKLLEIHPWVIPYNNVLNLTETSTKKLLKTKPIWPTNIRIEARKRHSGTYSSVGGLNVIPRHHFEAVGGFDERFVGWGREDDTFVLAMNAICGPFVRIDSSIYHLWHPPMEKSNLNQNDQLYQKYKKASGKKEAIEKLINDRKKK
ncbi:galactosyltransferase-related protein [Alkalihalobacillus sp. BA299]|uniref:galactosyltransferase-related protein n=1 Tax=Alkalihalobacillus sp. BA299 TaxID=2815938 RepID=UPI001ADAD53D|nr:galactosyltransferase-related protein [Alkalihalobacillus sp. BA299]